MHCQGWSHRERKKSCGSKWESRSLLLKTTELQEIQHLLNRLKSWVQLSCVTVGDGANSCGVYRLEGDGADGK